MSAYAKVGAVHRTIRALEINRPYPPGDDGCSLLKLAEPGIGKGVAGTIGRPLRWIHFAMGAHDCVMRFNFPAAFSQIINQFFAGFELAVSRLIAIEIAHQTNPERDVIQVIAVHMSAVDLTPPAIAHFNLAIAGGCPVSDDKMISESVAHPPDAPVIIIENPGAALSGTAVVHNNELPAMAHDWWAIDFAPDRPRKVTIGDFRTRPKPPATTRSRGGRRRLIALITNKS
jgi:hypothetical protein